MGQGTKSWADRREAWLVVAFAALVVLLVNPVGYSGGGRDDTRYVEAALCWVDAGRMCLPHDHWTTRWPAIAPLAGAIGLGGLNRTAVSFGTLPAFLIGIVLIGWLGHLWFSRQAGLVAATLFSTVPAISIHALRPNVDMIELDLQLAALALATLAIRKKSPAFAFAAGVGAGLAMSARDTSILFAGFGSVAWFTIWPHSRRLLLWSLAGLATVVGAEMVAFAATAGDPFLRYRLALAHGSVASTELAKWVDTSRSPILNPQFIAGWKRSIGIELWWPIDPWLNLFANPQIGPWLLTGPLAATAARDFVRPDERSSLIRIGLGSLMIAGSIVYVLAIDPKTRAFLLPLAGSCLALGWSISRLSESGRKLFAWFLFAALTSLGLFALSQYQRIQALERAAAEVLQTHPRAVEMDERTKEILLLVPGAAEAPIAPAGRPLRLSVETLPCAKAVERAIAMKRVAIEATYPADERSFLCLIRYE